MVRLELVNRKLELIAEDLGRLLPFRDCSFEEIVNDYIKLAAVERMLERIVIRAVDVNEHLLTELATGQEDKITRLTYRDTFLQLSDLGVYPREFAGKIARSAGLRNILVHDYNDVDREIVYCSIGHCLEDYTEYVSFIDSFVQTL